jgi:hypothetical protein
MTNDLLSPRFKNAVKTSLALVMAYGFALWFDWDRPMWAAFAVALVSLPTLEASLGKGAQRLRGTLMATVVGLGLIALFPQDRWPFMLAQASWLAYCTYRMTGGKNAYLWFCAGFVTAIITSNGGPDPTNAFSLATIRVLETSLGIICFALVFSLVWPVRTDQNLPGEMPEPPPSIPGVNRLNQASQVFIAYCVAFLLVIYVPGFPGSYGFLGMLAPFAIILATTPQLPAAKLMKPVGLSILFAAPIYMFLMPLLSGFTELAIVIFLTCFTICYALHTPEQGLARTFGLAFFAVVTGISNEQTYSFLALANTALMFSLVLLMMHLCTSVTVFVREKNGGLATAVENI